MKLQAVPFRARHVRDIIPNASDEVMRKAQRAEETGPAWSGFLYGRAFIAAGVSINQEMRIGEAWSLSSPIAKGYPLFVHREVKRQLDRIVKSLDEIYAACRIEDRWLVRLGFQEVPRETLRFPEMLEKLIDQQRIYVRRG